MKKDLMIVGGVVLGFFVLGLAIFFGISAMSNKMSCKSTKGDITLMYTSDSLTGYTANGISFDLDGQQAIAEQVGIESYLDEFESWFETNTGGTCSR